MNEKLKIIAKSIRAKLIRPFLQTVLITKVKRNVLHKITLSKSHNFYDFIFMKYFYFYCSQLCFDPICNRECICYFYLKLQQEKHKMFANKTQITLEFWHKNKYANTYATTGINNYLLLRLWYYTFCLENIFWFVL